MALNTHALRFVANRSMRVALGAKARDKCSIRGIDQFTFEAHVKVGAGATSINQRAYVETQATRQKIRFACTPTRDNGRSVLVFEFARTATSSPTIYRYELPNGWDNKWHHVAFSVSTGDAKYAIFFDDLKVKEGKLVGGGYDNYNRALLIDKDIPAEVSIGAYPTGSSAYVYWDGKIDNVRLFRTFKNSATYSSEDAPIDDHCSKVGAFAVDINLIEEWRFNEGPFGSALGMTYGVVDHQYDPKLKADEYAQQDNQNNNNNQTEEDFDPGPPDIADAELYEGSSKTSNLWIGMDVVYNTPPTGIVQLPKDTDRPFLGDGLSDTAAPSIPTDLQTAAITEDSFETFWRSSFDNLSVQEYEIEVSTQNSFNSVLYTRKTGTRTSERISGLVPGQRYYWRVRANDSSGNQSSWASSTAYTPFKLKSTSRVNYSPNPSFEGLEHLFAWEPHAVSGSLPNLSVTEYIGATRPDSNKAVYGNKYLTVQSNQGVSGLYKGASHTLSWKSGNQMTVSFWAKGNAAFGVYYYHMQDTRPLSASTLMSLKNLTSNQTATSHLLTSTWTRYTFTVTPVENNMNQIKLTFVCIDSAEFEFNIDGLLIESSSVVADYFDGSNKSASMPNTAYWVTFESNPTTTRDGYVVGASSGGYPGFTHGSPSAYDIQEYPISVIQTLDFTDRTAPDPPTTDTVSHAADEILDTSFLAKWKAPVANFEDIVAYDLQVGLKSNLSAADAVLLPGYESLRVYDAVLKSGVYERAVTGLAPSTSYYYRVAALDSNGNRSAWSSQGKLITTDAFVDVLPPSEVIHEEPTDITFDSFRVNWRESVDDVGVVGYNLTVALDADFQQVVSGYNALDVGNVLSYEVTGLEQRIKYYCRVRARDAAPNYSPLSSTSFVTVETLERPIELGGFVSNRLAIESLVPISTATPSTAAGESSNVTLNKDTQALLQFTLNRTVARGEVKNAFLNLTRYSTNKGAVKYTVTALNPQTDNLTAYYTPATVTYNNKRADASPEQKLEIYTDDPIVNQRSIVTLDLTPLLQRGSVYYGFRVNAEHVITAKAEATSDFEAIGEVFTTVNSNLVVKDGPKTYISAKSRLEPFLLRVTKLDNSTSRFDKSEDFFATFAGTTNSSQEHRPELSLSIDTSLDTTISVAQARTTSSPKITRNLYQNPTFDTSAGDITIPNSSFDLNDVAYWFVSAGEMEARLQKSVTSYDAVGGSGELVITKNNITSGLGAAIVSDYNIPVIKGKSYTARAFVATTSTAIKPRIAIYRYDQNAALIGQEYDQSTWTPSANVWYQRQKSYTIDNNDNTTKFIRLAIVLESTTATNESLQSVRVDAVAMTSDATDTPIYVEKLVNSQVSLSVSDSFDDGQDSTGSLLNVTTAASVGSGVSLTADVPYNESWIVDGLGNATINLVPNPSFESSLLTHVNSVGATTELSRSVVNGARGSRALRIQSSSTTHGVVVKSVTLPSYVSPSVTRSFVSSCWVLGGNTYKARTSIVYSDPAATTTHGSWVTFTVPANTWQRLTTQSSAAIVVSDDSIKNGYAIERVEFTIQVETNATPPAVWYIDGVQIEEGAVSASLPTTYCDGDQEGSYWYGVPHASISFRSAFVASYRLKTSTTTPNLITNLKIKTTNNEFFQSPPTYLSTIPSNAGWISVRSWPVVVFGQDVSKKPVQAVLDISKSTAAATTFSVDAVMISYNDTAHTYFNGSTLKANWRQLPFTSISDHNGVSVQSRVLTRGSLYTTGTIDTSFKVADYPDMGYQRDSSITARYERDSRYVDITVPDKIRWNYLHNPSFETGSSNWSSINSSIATKLTGEAYAGSFVGNWTITSAGPSSALLRSEDIIPAEEGQLWTFQTYLRAPLVTRGTTLKGRIGLVFYNSSGTEIGTVTNSDYAHSSVFELVNRSTWNLCSGMTIAPADTKWVRAIITNVSISGGSFGLLANDQIEIDGAMLYQGPAGRFYLDGDDDKSVFWEGRRHRSPSIFVFNSNKYYTFRFTALDSDSIPSGISAEQTILTAEESSDLVEFLFDEHARNATSRSVELVVPYSGQISNRTTLSGVYRRADMYERYPLTVEVNEAKREVYVRAEGLAQNREYVFEIDVISTDYSRVRGNLRYVTQVSSGISDIRAVEQGGDGTIQFAGFMLNGPRATYYWVSEHDALSLPDRRTQIETIPRMDGGIELKPYWGTKKISMSGGVWGNTRAELYNNVNALRAALVEQRGKLQIDTFASNEDFYYATCTSFSTKEVAGESLNSLRWDASFECSDPYMYRGEPRVSTFDIVSSKPNNTVDFFYTEDQQFTVFNAGTVNAVPTLTLRTTKGSGDYSVAFVNETTGQRLMPKSIINRNDILVVNSKDQTIKKNQSLEIDYVGSFIELTPGSNIIKASIKDLKAGRHNLLANAGAETGPAALAAFDNTDDNGIRPSYILEGTQKKPVTGVRVIRTRFQTATTSNYAALVECDGNQDYQGVVFNTKTLLSQERFTSNQNARRTFSAAAYVRTDTTDRVVTLNKCFIRIWYMDGSIQDEATLATNQYTLNSQWKLIQLPKLVSRESAINRVELFFVFERAIGSPLSFYIDNALLTQSDLSADQIEAAFQLTVAHQERFI